MIQSFVKDLIIYALPLFLARAIGLILLPIYTRQLGPEDFGFVEFVAAASSLILLILPLEINQAVGRLLPEHKEQSSQWRIVVSAFWFTALVFSTFGFIVYFFSVDLLKVANLPTTYTAQALLISLHFLMLAMVSLLQVIFRFTHLAKSSVIINIAVVLSNLLFVLYFINTEKLGIQEYFLSQILSNLIGVFIGIFILKKIYLKFPIFSDIDSNVLKQLLNYSTPIVLSSVGVVLISSVDRLMIGSYIGLQELGYYGVAMRISAIVGLGFYVVSSAMTPTVYRDHQEAETRLFVTKVFKFTLIGSIALLLLTAVCAKSIVGIFAGAQFEKASNYIFYVTLSAVISGFYIFFLGMDISKKTKLLSSVNLISGVLGTIFCVVLVPVVGVWGAILAALIANTARLSGYIFYSQRLYPLPISITGFALTIILLIIIKQLFYA